MPMSMRRNRASEVGLDTSAAYDQPDFTSPSDRSGQNSFAKRLTASLLILGIGTIVGVILTLGTNALLVGASSERQVVDASIWGNANIREVRQEFPVALTFDWSAEQEVLAPAWSGIVTAAPEIPTPIKTGDVIVEIDGVNRVASVGLAPFYRPLAPGSVGDDVEQLHAFLNQIGIEAPSGRRWVWSTTRAVREFNDAIGQVSRDSFDPSVVVWVPTLDFEVTESHLAVGSLAPVAGELILEQSSRVLGATFNPPLPPTSISSPSNTASLLGWELQLDKFVKVVDLVDDSSLMPVDSIGEEVLEGRPGSATGVLRSPQSANVLVVPPAAVLVDMSGDSCVITRRGDSIRAVSVDIVGGVPGSTYLSQEGLSVASEVLLNAALIESDRTCSR